MLIDSFLKRKKYDWLFLFIHKNDTKLIYTT